MLNAWLYHFAVAFFQSRPQRGVPGGTGRVRIGRPFERAGRNPGAAEEAKPGVVEIVAVEVVDVGAVRGAGRHERIDLLVLEEHRHAVAADLIAVVPADGALAGRRIVRLADAGREHQQHVVEDVGAEDDEAGRLLELLAAARVDIAHGLHLLRLLVVDELLHIGVGAQLEVRVRQQHRQDAGLRRRLGIGLAAEALAMAAIFAGAERDALRIGVDARSCWRRAPGNG